VRNLAGTREAGRLLERHEAVPPPPPPPAVASAVAAQAWAASAAAMHASGAGCGCPPRSRTDRMVRRGSMRLPACRRIIFAGFAAACFTP